MTLKEANRKLNQVFSLSCVDSGGLLPLEADDVLNDASRACIRACNDEYGIAWVGKINHYAGDPDHVMTWWDGGPVYNFGADFVLPVASEDVILLVSQYRRMPIEECAGWAVQLDKINHAIERAGGVLLAWS